MRNEPFDGKDIGSMELPELERLADDRNKRINEAGVFLTGLYWDLGAALLRMRELCRHGDWEKKLAKMDIERTEPPKPWRSSRPSYCRKDCEQLPVEAAYAMRKRKKTVEYTPPDPHDNSSFSPVEGIYTYNTPFQELEGQNRIKPSTADLVLSDPPYVGDWLPQLPDVAAFAAQDAKAQRAGGDILRQRPLGFALPGDGQAAPEVLRDVLPSLRA